MKILLTGSAGFVGSHLFRQLILDTRVSKLVGLSRRAQSYPWAISLNRAGSDGPYERFHETVNCDLTMEGQVASVMTRLQPDVVFHLAGEGLTKEWGVKTSLLNYLSTHHLLAHAPAGCRFIFASSATVYGDPTYPGDFKEDHPLNPTSAYGAAKAGSELLVRAFTAAGKVSGLSVRLAATVGAGATHGLVPDLVRKLRSDSETLELLGDAPGSVKPFTHVDDVVQGLVHLGLHQGVTGAINLASSNSISVQEAAEAVMQAIGVEKPITWSGSAGNWKGDNLEVRVSSKSAHCLGWRPKIYNSWNSVAQAAMDIDKAVVA